jgi:hypothetical protein
MMMMSIWVTYFRLGSLIHFYRSSTSRMLLLVLLLLCICFAPSEEFTSVIGRYHQCSKHPNNIIRQQRKPYGSPSTIRLNLSSDWSSFQALPDDEDDEIVYGKKIDRRTYAVENDDANMKASVGSSIEAPTILYDVDPIYVPAGSKLELEEETVLGLLSACRNELGTLFGYSEENRGVGITGSVEFVELDGGIVVLTLGGRYWHQRTTVLDRIANYLQQRIPEILEVTVVDPYQLTDEANDEIF